MEGDHVSRADRLPRVPEQRARLRARDREAAGARGAAEGHVDAHAPLRAEPDPLAPRVARDVRPRAGCDLDVLVLLPRARADPRSLRARRGLPDAHALLPGRRPGGGHPARLLPRVPQVRRADAVRGGRVRAARRPEPDLARADAGRRPAQRRRRDRARPVGPGPARVGGRLGPPARRAVPRLRQGRLSRPGLHARRRLRPLPRPHGRDARVDAHRRAVPRPPRGHGGRALDRRRPQGRAAAARGAPHVDGVAHPPLQDRHRGIPRARGRGLRRRSSRRAASSGATSSRTAGRSRGA